MTSRRYVYLFDSTTAQQLFKDVDRSAVVCCRGTSGSRSRQIHRWEGVEALKAVMYERARLGAKLTVVEDISWLYSVALFLSRIEHMRMFLMSVERSLHLTTRFHICYSPLHSYPKIAPRFFSFGALGRHRSANVAPSSSVHSFFFSLFTSALSLI